MRRDTLFDEASAVYLRNIRCIDKREGEYPFTVPVVAALESMEFTTPVTILCGDNGCGKTTLMGLIAAKLNAIRIQQNSWEKSEKQKILEQAAGCFRASFGMKAKRNFFFSAEDFIKYIDWIEMTKAECLAAIAQIDAEWQGDDYSKGLAKMPHYRTLSELSQLYANELSRRSHGEGFLDFFQSRLVDGGLYLMDEPESALSYENQYVLAVMIGEAVKRRCQFIIATHSPVISAIPQAALYELDGEETRRCTYEELKNVSFLQMFLKRRDRMLQ